jgi:hypothetical protein
MHQALAQINCTKTKLAASLTFRATLLNKWITEVRHRTGDTEKPCGNAIVRRLHAPLPGN